jgi:predicted CXXCH cytochrome family protein
MSRDGVFAEFKTFPTAHDLFGGALDPTHAGWANPVPDTWTHHIPADAPAGTYDLTIKGRRTYMGEDIPFTRVVQVQVGTATPTKATLNTGGCGSCHNGQSSFKDVLHADADRSSCAGCHAPLGIELEGPIYVRTHFLHSRSHRYPAPLDNCSSCHLTRASIQRVSKSACLSCHRSYPQSHVEQFGPIESIYVGGSRESFQQCTTACHRNHPNSQL